MEKAILAEGKTEPCNPADCPMKELITRIGDKWSLLVLISLAKVPQNRLRFSELMAAVDGISQRMLSSTLKYLERDGIVSRHIYPEVPPRVEYTLTKRGIDLLVPVKTLFSWIQSEWPDIEKSRRNYDLRTAKNVRAA